MLSQAAGSGSEAAALYMGKEGHSGAGSKAERPDLVDLNRGQRSIARREDPFEGRRRWS